MKRIISIMLVLALMIAITACGDNEDIGAETSGETKIITDCSGRKVEIPADPQRVAVFYASTAHMMAMLDEGNKIVGASKGIKTDELMVMKYPGIADVSTPSQEGSINTEELLNLDADLALIRNSIAADEGETEKLDQLGIPYVVVDYLNIAELNEAITVMGQVFGKEDKAEKYNKFMNETIDMVQDSLKNVNKSDSPVVYHAVNEAIRTDMQNDICMEIMGLAGTVDACTGKSTQKDGDKNYTTLEEIYNWDASAIIANESSVTDYILSDSKWSGLDAVKNKAVYTLPVGATRWCHPGSMEPHMAVLAIAKMFHPEEFKDVDLVEYTQNYYKEYFDMDLNKETVEKVLSGRGMRKSNAPINTN